MIASSPVRMQDHSATSMMHAAAAVQIHHQFVHHAAAAAAAGLSSSESPAASGGAVIQSQPGATGLPLGAGGASVLASGPVDCLPVSMPWSCAGASAVGPPCVGYAAVTPTPSAGTATSSLPLLTDSDNEFDVMSAPHSTTGAAAFQQLLDSFGCQLAPCEAEGEDESLDDDDTVVNIDELLSVSVRDAGHTHAALGTTHSLRHPHQQHHQQQTSRIQTVLQPQQHAVCSAARC